MNTTDQEREDEVLRRMLQTPHKPQKALTGGESKKVTRPEYDRVTPNRS